MPQRWRPDRRSLLLLGLVLLGGAVASTTVLRGRVLVNQSSASNPSIPVAALRPPPEYVAGMTRFLDVVNDRNTRWGRGMPGGAPVHGTAVWGHYVSDIDEEPWKSQLLAQLEAVTGGRGRRWPALPISGPILNELRFHGRLLEVYVDVHVMPSEAWAKDRSDGLHRSAAGSLRSADGSVGVVGSPCAYGQDCLRYTATVSGLPPPHQEQRLWQWRVGRVVISVSALGAPGWPEDQITPLVEYYATTVANLPGVHDDDPSVPPPPL